MSEHTPVLVQEVLGVLEPKPGSILLDATLGHGGHAKAFLEEAGDSSRVIGVDADPEALAVAKQTLAEFGDRVSYVQGNFFSLPDTKVTAILFDQGIGSHRRHGRSDRIRRLQIAAEDFLFLPKLHLR